MEQRHEYKNAADLVLRTEYTPAHREALERLAESVFDDAVQTIADARGLDHDRVRELINTGPRTAAEARDVGLVDRLGYRDQVYDELRARTDGKPELLFADRGGRAAACSTASPPRSRCRRRRPGAIVTGRSRRSPMGRQAGSDTVSAARAAHDNDRAQAVVLRVESGEARRWRRK